MIDLDDGFELDDRLVEPRRSLVTLPDGEERRLEPRAMAALVHLAGAAGEVVRREALIDDVWRTTVGDEVLSRAVSLIRQALGDEARAPRFVETVPKIGYRLLVTPRARTRPVEATTSARADGPPPAPGARPETGAAPPVEHDHAAPPSAPPEAGALPGPAGDGPAPAAGTPGPPRRRRLGLALAALVVLAGVAGLILRPWEDPAPADAPPAPRALVILPLEDVALEGESRPLGLGLSDMLRAELGRDARLRVLARSSSLAVAREAEDARALGERFGIDAVLEGSVIQGADRVTVHLTLSDARDGYQRWAETFDGRATDLFELSRSMVRALESALATGSTPTRAAPAPDGAAWTLYLQGLHHFALRGADGLGRAQSLFEQALEADPGFDTARVALARTRALTPYWTPLAEDDAFPEALDLLAAIDSDDALVRGQAAAVRGFVHFRRWQWAEAGAAFDTALRLAPQDAGIRAWHAQYLAAIGELEAALAEAREAWALDPGSPIVGSRVAIGELWLDQPEAAARYYDTTDPVALVRRDPSYLVYLLRVGRDAEVADLLRQVHEAAGLETGWVDAAIALMRDAPERATHLAEYEAAIAAGAVHPRMQLAIWILAGEHERATAFIERFRERRRFVDVEFVWSAMAKDYRASPAFERALEVLGLDDRR